jgi:hypothetical protein
MKDHFVLIIHVNVVDHTPLGVRGSFFLLSPFPPQRSLKLPLVVAPRAASSLCGQEERGEVVLGSTSTNTRSRNRTEEDESQRIN